MTGNARLSGDQERGVSASNSGAYVRVSIEDAIAWGIRLPGERLDEQQLALEFGVSRTPVREALQQLAAAGLVETRPRRGTFVATPSPTRLYEMFEVMAELESFCARLAARRANAAGAEDLLAAHRACEAHTGSPDAYYAANEAFHQAIYRLSGNAFLADEAMALQKRLKPFRRLQLRVAGRIGDSLSEHGRIVELILAGNGEGASEAIRAHVRVQGERFSDLVATLAALKAA
jgi:DNA-binding GntR family transcriptional regulator